MAVVTAPSGLPDLVNGEHARPYPPTWNTPSRYDSHVICHARSVLLWGKLGLGAFALGFLYQTVDWSFTTRALELLCFAAAIPVCSVKQWRAAGESVVDGGQAPDNLWNNALSAA